MRECMSERSGRSRERERSCLAGSHESAASPNRPSPQPCGSPHPPSLIRGLLCAVPENTCLPYAFKWHVVYYTARTLHMMRP